MVKVNLTQEEIKAAQSSRPAPLPAGIYGAIIYTAVQKDSKAKKPMFEIDFKITDGPAGIGRKQRAWFSLAPNALFSTIALMKALDLPYPDKDAEPGEFDFTDAEDLVGERVNIRLIQTPFNTVDDDDNPVVAFQNEVKGVKAYDESKHTSADDVEDGADTSGVFLS